MGGGAMEIVWSPGIGTWDFSSLPPSQTQRVADDDQIGQAHRQSADDRAEEAERRQRNGRRVVEKGPEQILPDSAQGGLRQAKRFGNRLDVRLQQNDIGGFASDIAGPSNG